MRGSASGGGGEAAQKGEATGRGVKGDAGKTRYSPEFQAGWPKLQVFQICIDMKQIVAVWFNIKIVSGTTDCWIPCHATVSAFRRDRLLLRAII